jgi:CRISPR-associated endonuclease/helicase Cas3
MTCDKKADSEGLLLTGLDGSNPLGFLAALGTLRVLAPTYSMAWTPIGGTWVPKLLCDEGTAPGEETVLAQIQSNLADDISGHPCHLIGLLQTDDRTERRRLFIEQCSLADLQNRDLIDMLAAVASDAVPSAAINQLQTARRDYFLLNLREVIARTEAEDLRRSLFQPWDYADPLDKQSLHLDPSEDRRHAYQWNQPSGDPHRKLSGGMLGANRLAIEAFPLFTSIPEDDSLRTLGFTGTRSTNTRWTWPLWDVPAALLVVRSLMASPELQAETFDPDRKTALHRRGIVAAFRTNRILVGKTPNFTPARRVA